jgi:FAD/FMN-containing dehydrogenase
MSEDALSRIKDAVGPKGFSDDPQRIAPLLEEWRGSYHGRTSLLVMPATTDEVSRVLAICNGTGTPIVPQGGNTGLVGGQIPFGGEVLLSTRRMNRIRALDKDGASITAEAGAVLFNVQTAAEDAGLLFPLSLAAEGSCTIGGNLSTNAGGVNVLRYGMARDLVLGLEVVLADGRVLDMLRTLRKDNTGYDLKQLFIGAEGTLGVITAAALKLFPRPRNVMTALVPLADPDTAIALLAHLQASTGGLITAFELIPRIGIDLALKHIDTAIDPIQTQAPWYALVEGPPFDEALGDAEAVIAVSETQRGSLWRLRDSLSEAQKLEGPSLKHDVSVPLAAIPAFIDEATAAVLAAVPEARPVTFGHVGDGNLHFNFNVPDTSRRADVARIVHDIVHRHGGSFSAEHGVGAMKREELLRYKSATEIEVMRTLKHALDPKNILNPGKIL